MGTSRELVADYRAQLEAVRREERELVAGLSDAQFNWRPHPEAWSAGDVLAHLATANDSYLGAIERALAKARERGRTDEGGEYRHGMLGGALARAMEPGSTRKFKAPRIFRPPPAPMRDLELTVGDHRRTLDRVEAALAQAEGLDLRRARMASTVSPLLRMNAGDALLVILAHERRHLHQIRALREQPRFPTS